MYDNRRPGDDDISRDGGSYCPFAQLAPSGVAGPASMRLHGAGFLGAERSPSTCSRPRPSALRPPGPATTSPAAESRGRVRGLDRRWPACAGGQADGVNATKAVCRACPEQGPQVRTDVQLSVFGAQPNQALKLTPHSVHRPRAGRSLRSRPARPGRTATVVSPTCGCAACRRATVDRRYNPNAAQFSFGRWAAHALSQSLRRSAACPQPDASDRDSRSVRHFGPL